MNAEIEKMLHDLRGPLAVIKSFLSAIEKNELPEQITELHSAAVNSVKKIAATVDNLSGGKKRPETL